MLEYHHLMFVIGMVTLIGCIVCVAWIVLDLYTEDDQTTRADQEDA